MDRPAAATDGSGLPTWLSSLGFCALLAWHGLLTLALFGPEPWETLTNDEPIVSGVHAQKQYIGQLGAHAILHHGRTFVYDDRFQIGWPKTPIFDGGRLAELFLTLGGGCYNPAAYKIGFAIVCMLVPVFLLIAARTIGLGNGAALLATFLGQLVWWGPHGRAAIISGDCELYLAALAALAHVGFLIAYHRTTSVWSWFGLWLTGCVAWFLQPLLFPIALPVLLTYYLTVGTRHDFLTWHFAFWGAEILAVVVNLPWLVDWLDSWWLRTPLPLSADLLQHRTIINVWNAPLWGGPTSRALALFVLGSALVGVIVLNQTRERAAARLLGFAAGGALVLALLGISWEPLGIVGTAALLAPALWFACLPAAHAWSWFAAWSWRRGVPGRIAMVALAGGTAAGLYLATESPETLLARCVPGEPLEIGLDSRRSAIVQTLRDLTGNDARILWEDRQRPRQASRWPALLPILTERSYIGGLDPDGFIEHSSICLLNQNLEGHSIADAKMWSDHHLTDYCRRFNVRWVVAWSPLVIERFSQWPDAVKRVPLSDDEVGWLFEIKRRPNLALRGHAELVEANGRYIALKNVAPENGEVVLSLHYHSGMRASLPRVQVDRAVAVGHDSVGHEAVGHDSVGFVRLKLGVEAKHLTISWER